MSQVNKVLTVSVVALCTMAGGATAAEKRNDAYVSSRGTTATTSTQLQRPMALSGTQAVAANSAYARVSLVWDSDYGIVRSKNVYRVRNPAQGIYCVQPAGMTSTQVRNLVPNVTVDYSSSYGEDLRAYYRSVGGCYANEIGVVTKRFDGSRLVNSDLVGFSLTAP